MSEVRSLSWKSINKATKEALEEIKGRKEGTIKSLQTSMPKLDKALFDGFPWGSIILAGGLSGSGKSMFVEQLKRDFVNYNPNEKFEILSFEFEMLGKMQVLRNLSGKLGTSVRHLLSADSNTLSDGELDMAKGKLNEISRYPISYVDNAGTSEEIEKTISSFIEVKKLKEDKKGLIITMDHVLLAKENLNESERIMLRNISNAMIRVKKKYSDEFPVMIILVTQLNRNIEQKERILNEKLHMPNKTDIQGSSSLFQSCDFCLVLHNPSTLKGIGDTYSHEKLPLYTPDEQNAMIYIHVLKARTGEQSILAMKENFANSRIEEYNDL
jgi:replicative DNA helicase